MKILVSTAGAPAAGRSTTAAGGRLLVSAVLAGSLLAWLVLVLSHSSALDHERLGGLVAHHSGPAGHGEAEHGEAARGALGRQAAVVVVGWTVMVVAMMLPPALPMLQLLRQLVARRRRGYVLTAVGAVTFTSLWVVVGVVLIAGDAVLHNLLESRQDAASTTQLVTGAVLVGAGVYQFTPLKNACLRGCRSPRSFALAHWRGQRPAAVEAAALSGAYAVSCVGCCWALMTICFAVGAAALPVMVVLAVLMAAERLLGWGRRLVRPVGVLLLALGLVTALGLLPTGVLAG